CNLTIRNLALVALAAELPCRLDQQQDAVVAGVTVREATATGVERERPTRSDGSALYEGTAFALGTEAQVVQEHDGRDREAVVELRHVDVLRGHSGHLEGLLARLDRGGRRVIRHARNPAVADGLAGAEYVNGRLPQGLRTLRRSQNDRATAIV